MKETEPGKQLYEAAKRFKIAIEAHKRYLAWRMKIDKRRNAKWVPEKI
jgi:hypothetical protein